MISHRALEKADAKVIVAFPQSAEELFFMFPKASYPLQPERLLQEAQIRFYPTVVLVDQQLAGYGNFISAEHGHHCSIGNVVVNPAMRRRGVASYLLKTLVAIAFDQLKAKYVRISCFNNNTAGLLLYQKLGFRPVDVEIRETRDGRQVALIHMHKFNDDEHNGN
jgi:ribosomal protein S18 acetylase RimI-like enzyme